jgi:hypothetical protein
MWRYYYGFVYGCESVRGWVRSVYDFAYFPTNYCYLLYDGETQTDKMCNWVEGCEYQSFDGECWPTMTDTFSPVVN